MSKITRSFLVIFLWYFGMGLEIASAQSKSNTQDISHLSVDRVADMIITGLITERNFRESELTPTQRLDVFKQIRSKRGWTTSDTTLANAANMELKEPEIVTKTQITPLYYGSCSQAIEQQSGTSFSAYPSGQTSPNGSECGGDPDDIILLYNTPNAPNTATDYVRWYSTIWWVRSVISTCYSNGISANSLCSTQTRVCMGSCGQTLGSDLYYLYIWQIQLYQKIKTHYLAQIF